MKKIIACIIALVIILSISILPVSAVSVDLLPNQYENYSNNVSAKQCRFKGTNNGTSSHMVYFHSQISTSTGYKNNVTYYAHIGESFAWQKTESFSNNQTWRLRLNPTGLYKNCSGTGYIVKVS